MCIPLFTDWLSLFEILNQQKYFDRNRFWPFKTEFIIQDFEASNLVSIEDLINAATVLVQRDFEVVAFHDRFVVVKNYLEKTEIS